MRPQPDKVLSRCVILMLSRCVIGLFLMRENERSYPVVALFDFAGGDDGAIRDQGSPREPKPWISDPGRIPDVGFVCGPGAVPSR